MYGRALLLSLDCSTLPLIRTLYCWVLSKEVSSTIFTVFVWDDLRLNPSLTDHWQTLHPLGQLAVCGTSVIYRLAKACCQDTWRGMWLIFNHFNWLFFTNVYTLVVITDTLSFFFSISSEINWKQQHLYNLILLFFLISHGLSIDKSSFIRFCSGNTVY